ncbi:MAG TPA: hemerythrin domain-containing protein [Ilumatobacteraceae bacterium]
MPNGIDLLIADHEMVKQLFAEFQSTGNGALVGQIIDALKAHDEAEHAALYPMCELLLDDSALVARCQAAHSAVKRQIDVVAGLEGPPLVAATKQLQALVTSHADEEERRVFPKLARAASAGQLEALGPRVMQAKQRGG